MGGIILKWGTGTSTGGSSGNTITFVTPFPNNCFVVQANSTDTGTATTAYTMVYARSFAAANFNLLTVNRTTLTAVSSNYSYIAIGN
jgi:hypothetical protein